MSKRKITISTSAVFLVILLASSSLIIRGHKASADSLIFESSKKISSRFHPKEIIVKFKPGTSKEKIEAMGSGRGTKLRDWAVPGFAQMEMFGDRQVEDLLDDYRKDPDVEYAEPNYFISAQMVPNDPLYKSQWNLKKIGMEKAWDVSTGESVTVAVIDSGVAYENYKNFKKAPDFKQTNFTPGYDFLNSDTHPNDDFGHGTHMAGIIAASTNNRLGTAGIAYKASIMPIKVLDNRGEGNYYDVAKGIVWAADHGAKIINLSVGGTEPASYLEDALKYAYEKGVVIFASSGNGSKEKLYYPAAYDKYVIAVGSAGYDGIRPGYSNYGDGLDIVAPGGNMDSDMDKNGYGDGIIEQTFDASKPSRFSFYYMQGTSMASAHAAGLAALLCAKETCNPSSVRNALIDTASGGESWNSENGYGLVDAAKALDYFLKNMTPEEKKFQENGFE